MNQVLIHTVHERQARVTISKNQLEEMVKEYAIRLAGFCPDATSFVVRFEDHIEGGSIGYKTGTKCLIELKEDQQKLPQAAP